MLSQTVYQALTGADDEAPPVGRHEAKDGAVQIVALSFTKIADGLVDPKLVLAWLLSALGAPAIFIGALVPVREAGALLPQLALARRVERGRLRKTVWSTGAALQGICALGIAASAYLLEGLEAGLGVVVCLAGLSLARSACSVSHKDALARTVAKTRRGAVTGAASGAASTAVLGFGVALAIGLIPLEPRFIVMAIGLAGMLWLAAAAVFLFLSEQPQAAGRGQKASLAALVRPFWTDAQLRRFVAARALLTVTALAPPYLVMLSVAGDARRLGHLGPLVLASAGASILSSYVWGRLSDRSSRQTLMAAGALGAVALGSAAAMGLSTGGLGGVAGSVLAMFAAEIAYRGVRTGRKVHLIDMAGDQERARYTALSNSLIGVVLALGGLFGLLADLAGPAWVLAVFAALCALAAAVAASLEEVQTRD